MNNLPLDLDLQIYQQISTENDESNAFKSAEIQRKSIAQMYNASCKNLDNLNTCELLDRMLANYDKTVFKNGKSIYSDRFNNVLDQAKEKPSAPINTNLNKIDLNSVIDEIPCSVNHKFSCSKSEQISNSEFKEFLQVYENKKRISKSEFNKSTTNQAQGEVTSYFSKANTFSNCEEIVDPKFAFKTANDELQLQSWKRYGNSAQSSSNSKPNIKTKENTFSSCEETVDPKFAFKTANDELQLQSLKRFGNSAQSSFNNNGNQKRKLGLRRNVKSKFISPLLSNNYSSNEEIVKSEGPIDERLKNIEPKMVELIKSEIMDCGANIHWTDIAGLDYAKTAIQEAVVWPMLRPDLFTGLRRPPKGILLFGPPGTGKTLIGKCVASQSKSTFFSISASSLTSKWIGDGEKMVRALFAVARVEQPSVIFIDEIDSLLSQRSDTEHESSRRIKTEFLVQLDGATTDSEDRILVIGATNRPQDLDEAARRRFLKRLYIPLPDYEARLQLVQKLICDEKHCMKDEDFKTIASLSDGYSGADIRNLCSEASLGPIRSIDMKLMEKIQTAEVRPLLMEDFEKAFTRIRTSVSSKDLDHYLQWDKIYGSGIGV